MILDPKQLLAKIGLNDGQTKVYLGLLQFDEATVTQIAERVGITRSNAHFLLDELEKENMVTFRIQGKRTKIFRAASPHIVVQRQKELATLFETALPGLLNLSPDSLGALKVDIRAGREALMQHWDDTLTATEILTWTDDSLLDGLGLWLHGDESIEFISNYVATRLQNQTFIRSIAPYETNEKEAKKLGLFEAQQNFLAWAAEGEEQLREVKFVPREYAIPYEISLYNDIVAVISYKNGTIVRLTSPELTRAMSIIYETVFNGMAVDHPEQLA